MAENKTKFTDASVEDYIASRAFIQADTAFPVSIFVVLFRSHRAIR